MKCNFYWVHVSSNPHDGLLYFTKEEAQIEAEAQRARSGQPWRTTMETREEADFSGYSDSDSKPVPANCIY